jgi:hypothetical protein
METMTARIASRRRRIGCEDEDTARGVARRERKAIHDLLLPENARRTSDRLPAHRAPASLKGILCMLDVPWSASR